MTKNRLSVLLFGVSCAFAGSCDDGSLFNSLIGQVISDSIDSPILELSDSRPISLDELAEIAESVFTNSGGTTSPDAVISALIKAILEYSKNRSEHPDADERSSDQYNALTRAERDLLIREFWNISRTKRAGDDAFAEEARRFGSSGHNDDKADAFRHAYWSAILAKRISIDWSRRFTTAHESGQPESLRKTMDLNNNSVGRNIYQQYQSLSETLLGDKILAYPTKKISKPNQASTSFLVYFVD